MDTNNSSQKSIFIQQPILPHYRAPFFERLANRFPNISFFLSYDKKPQTGFISTDLIVHNITYLKSSWKLVNSIVFNFSILKYLFTRFDLYIFNDNVRSPALYIFLLFNRLFSRRTLLWGHGVGTTHPGLGLFLRRILLFLASGYIVYSPDRQSSLRKLSPTKPVFLASNSLDTSVFLNLPVSPSTDLFSPHQLKRLSHSDVVLVYVSRLEPEKSPFKLLDLMSHLDHLGATATLIVVGDGTLLPLFKSSLSASSLINSVILTGSITDPSTLGYIFSLSDFLVHPGVIGLTLQMSFCLSTPVVTSFNARHMPEFTLFKHKQNGLLVDFDDIPSVAEQILSTVSSVEELSNMKQCCYETIYSTSGVNIERFVDEFSFALRTTLDL